MAEQFQERTEPATPKRLREARDKGQVARSRELNAFLVVIVGTLGASTLGLHWVEAWIATSRMAFGSSAWFLDDPRQVTEMLSGLGGYWLLTLTPYLLLMVGIALLAPVLLGGFLFSTQALLPRASRLNPLTGLGRVFGTQGLVELAKSVGKFLLVAGIAAALIWQLRGELFALSEMAPAVGIARAGELLSRGFILVAAGLAVIALVDVPYQLWQHARQTRMTRQEVRDELRQTEGDPQLKARVRQAQREMARRRMMELVPTADVVIANPSHYAVALKYDNDRMLAPRVVAKGIDLVALKIRELAAAHEVRVFESPVLARALYFTTPLQAEIPQPLFVAVAQVLAYVYELDRVRGTAGRPRPPIADAAVPPEYADLARRRGPIA